GETLIECAPASSGASALGGDQLIDPSAQLPQHEVLLGRGLAVVDLLDPLLQRHLDLEGLIDGEGDVEKVERVDPQIVDDVALRRDVLARDVADLGDDVRDGLEGGCHDVLVVSARAGYLQTRRRPFNAGPSEVFATPKNLASWVVQRWRGPLQSSACGSERMMSSSYVAIVSASSRSIRRSRSATSRSSGSQRAKSSTSRRRLRCASWR